MEKAEATASVIMAKKMARTRSENRPMTSASATASAMAASVPMSSDGPGRTEIVEREPRAVAADAEEHGVGERHDAGIAEQQVVARGEHDEVADLGGDIERLRPGKQQRREGEAEEDRRQQDRQHAAARRIAGEERAQDAHRFATG